MAGAKKYRYYKRKLHFKTPGRILLHLLNYVGSEGEITLPDDLTQFGIADAIGLGRTTVSKVIRRLIKEGAIRSRRAHVPSGSLRRTVYVLTDAGVGMANARKREIEEEVVRFRDGPGSEQNLRMGDVPNLLPGYATFLQVAKHVSEGVFDLSTFRPDRGKWVDFTERMPRLRYFFGREGELAAADDWLEDPDGRVLVITGLAGIGKTTLLSRKLDDWRDRRHLFFQRIQPWTTLRHVTLPLSEFLTRLSRKALAQYVEATQTTDIEQVVEILRADLDGVPAVLVYDDYQNAEPAVRDLFLALRATLETMSGPKVVVAGRHVAGFYDRRDLRVKRLVREIELDGLDPVSAGQLIETRNVRLPATDLKSLLERTGGHPLFLELADLGGGTGIEDIHRYLNEELLSRITDKEAQVLTLASVFRGPVPADALYEEDGVEASTIRGLVEQSLLREVSMKVFDVHDLIRSFLLEMATRKDRRRFHRMAARFYLSATEPNALEALFHLVEANEFTTAARLAVKDGPQILKGETQEMLAVLDRLLPHVEDPSQAVELRLLKAQALDYRGEPDGAIQIYLELIQTTNPSGFERKIAEARHRLGDIYRRLRERTAAEEHLEEGLRLYRAGRDTSGEAEVLAALGILFEDRGEFAKAERSYERSRTLARRLGMREVEAELEVATARLLALRGDLQGSLERKRHALALAESLGNLHLLSKVHISLGTVYYNLAKYSEASDEYELGIQFARRIGNLRMLAWGLYHAAGLYLRKEDYTRGESCLREAGPLFRKLGDPVSEALVLQYEGTMWSKRGKWGLGKAKLADSVARLRRTFTPDELAKTLYAFSWQSHLHGEEDAAIHLIDEAIATARKIRLDALVDEMQGYRNQYTRGLVGESRHGSTDAPSAG